MIPKPDLKLFLGAFLLSVILFSNAYDCCSGSGKENETTKAPAVETSEAPAAETTEAPEAETSEAPAVETTEAPVAETTEVPAAGTTVTIGMISRQFKSSGSQA